ncbi:J-type chaperone JAC1 ASCRUDRAFT_24257, partial [Ascoidea rubescens DSM 1968]
TRISRCLSIKTGKNENYFKIFPKTFPKGGLPSDEFLINLRTLRNEYLKLQSINHPDMLIDKIDEFSSFVNKAYSTLKSPLTRSQYFLLLNNIDLINDKENKNTNTNSNSVNLEKMKNLDSSILMEIYETCEEIENCENEKNLKILNQKNNGKIKNCELKLNELYSSFNSLTSSPNSTERKSLLKQIIKETIKLKYWFNIKKNIKEWEPGKEVVMNH